MRAGELREKVTVKRPVRTPDGSGGMDTAYDTILNSFAKVVEERSDPRMIANQEDIINYVHFAIRYRPQVFIKIGDRLVWRSFNFTVNNIKVDPLRTRIDIFVNTEMETSER